MTMRITGEDKYNVKPAVEPSQVKATSERLIKSTEWNAFMDLFRQLQSKETGYIHTFYGKTEAPHQAVCVLDNLLFALALCRQKTVDGVTEGKELVEKLLAYQSKEGFFPAYLHEFPNTYDRHIGADLLPPLFLIYQHFHHVLGLPNLKNSIEELLSASLQESDKMAIQNQFKVGGVLCAFGKMHDRKDWIAAGKKLLDIGKLLSHPSRFIPKHLGEAMLGAYLGDQETADCLMGWMKSLWHPALKCYAGPFARNYFRKGKPEITLYELFMGLEAADIKGVLLFPHEFKPVLQNPIECHLEEKLAYSWLDHESYPFVFQWQNAHLIVYAPFAKAKFNGKNTLTIQLQESSDENELFIYITPKEGMNILINGEKATTFSAGDTVSIQDQDVKINLAFETVEGRFLGHLSKGCLPTEKENFGKNRFNAYEWQLLWRTLSRPEKTEIKLHFSYEA